MSSVLTDMIWKPYLLGTNTQVYVSNANTILQEKRPNLQLLNAELIMDFRIPLSKCVCGLCTETERLV